MGPRHRTIIGSETSPAGSLNHEVHEWFRHMAEVFVASCQLERRMNVLYKRLTHRLALYMPQLRQLTQQTLFAASHPPDRFSYDAWVEWCSPLTMDTATRFKAKTLIHSRRTQQTRIQPHGLQKTHAPITTHTSSVLLPIQIKVMGSVRKRHPCICQRIRRRTGE